MELKINLDKNKSNYSLGFLFDHHNSNVVLILKQRPDWQRGKFNGIGGKLEDHDRMDSDTIYNDDMAMQRCMQREFYEETGKVVDWWQLVAKMSGQAKHDKEHQWDVYCYAAWKGLGFLQDCKKTTDEEVMVMDIQNLYDRGYKPFVMDNILPLIQLSLSVKNFPDNWFEIKERFSSQ